MKKLLTRVAAFAIAMLSMAISANAQQPQPMPVDPAVRVGKLDNGITYYIRQNANPKGQADFYIAQKVGSVLEEENQRGLAHFLEHMCFNGTENFPGNSLIDWLESVGVKFGQNLNAYTSIDETVYNISAVPTARQSVQDSCLLILHDWACALTLDPEEIDKERGVIHEEWRRSMSGQMRIIENLLPVIYPNNRYGERLPIGTMEVVDNFPPQALRDYYHTWYRPDQQGVIVVGDIDPDYIEAKIKELFGPIEMPADAKERVYFDVEDNEETIYAIGADPEMTAPAVMISFKVDKLIPKELNNTQQHYVINYLTGMISAMLNQRYNDLAMNPEATFSGAHAEIGDFFISSTKDALTVEFQAKGNDILPAVKDIYRELLRARDGGFTSGEYERARSEFLSSVEQAYNNRNDRQTATYSNEYVRAFINNEPIPGEEIEWQLYQAFVPQIPLEVINSVLTDFITDENRIFMALLPENGELLVPTAEQVTAAMAEVDAEEIEPYVDAMREDPLIPQLPAPGAIVAVEHNDLWDATVYTLSNGVKVIVKPTQFKQDEVLFTAIAKEGIAILDPAQKSSNILLPQVANANGINLYSNSDLEKYLQGKKASIGINFGNYSHEVSGQSSVKDLPTLMELIYGLFTGYTIDETEFEALRSMLKPAIAAQMNTPEYQFNKVIMADIFASPNKQMISTEDVDAADRSAIIEVMHGFLDNAADYTFVFVGNVDDSTIRPLLEQYIATLPADAATAVKTYAFSTENEIARGTAEQRHTTAMQTPQSWVFIAMSAKLPYSAKNEAMASMYAQILSNRLLKKVREEMGATYSIGCYGDMNRLSENNVLYQIAFPMKPELKEETLPIIRSMVEDMAKEIRADELDPAKEFMVKNATAALEKNGEWLEAISETTLNDVPTFFDQASAAQSVTLEDLQKFAAEIVAQGNYRTVLLDPEE